MIEYEYRVRMLTSPGSPDRDYEVPEGWAQAEIERELDGAEFKVVPDGYQGSEPQVVINESKKVKFEASTPTFVVRVGLPYYLPTADLARTCTALEAAGFRPPARDHPFGSGSPVVAPPLAGSVSVGSVTSGCGVAPAGAGA